VLQSERKGTRGRGQRKLEGTRPHPQPTGSVGFDREKKGGDEQRK